uniref:Aminopeptidase n=1 Tax=Cynoglossus semilaevis TaxID=244447 RepID=A0A3P8X317_CYNSE
MSKKTHRSRVVAVVLVVLTVSVIAAIATMVIFFKIQTADMNPTSRPTISPSTTPAPPVTRLPRSVIPDRYKIFLHLQFYTRTPEFENTTNENQTERFTGNSTLFFKSVQRSSAIYLHSSNLTVFDSVVRNVDTGEVVESRVEYNHEWSEFLQVSLGQALEVDGNYSLSLKFEGWMAFLNGMFLSIYEERDSETLRFLVVTHMQPTDARKVFPCLDEPDLKAVFQLNVIHRRDSSVLGNAEIFGKRKEEEFLVSIVITQFYPTPRMSTYLLALAVSEFTPTPSLHDRVQINVTAAGHALFAANMTGKILQFFEEMLGINYPQKKLDQIAVLYLDPEIAAMENWGLITYLEEVLLYEEGVSSLLDKETITEMIAHELAHQWFGNLVTMKWWNELWLNEGFATYMTYKAVDQVEPHFKTVRLHLQAAFSQDVLASSHPLIPPPEKVQTNSEIKDMFDDTTYTKGAMILRMLVDIVEERVFNKGIRSYLLDFSYRNSETRDLWNHIQKAVNEDGGHTRVAEVMESWTTQTGYPVITINTSNGEVSQKHFLLNHSSESRSERRELPWLTVDLNLTLKKEELISKNEDWVLANVNWTGYYRVNYDPGNWQSLLTQLETEPQKIPIMNRGQLIDDVFNLARAKLVNVTLALNFTRFLRKETAFLPWELAIKNLKYYVHMFDRSEVYGPLQVISSALSQHYQDTPPPPTPHLHNQVLAINLGCSSGLPECVSMARTMFSEWMNNTDYSIHPNLRSEIYCHGVAAGGVAEWEFAWRMFENSIDISEKEHLKEALSCTKKIPSLNRYLQYTLDPEKIRLADVASIISFVVRNVAGQAPAWDFVRANWDYVENDCFSDRWTAQCFCSSSYLFVCLFFFFLQMQQFFVENNMQHSVDAQKCIEEVQVNIQWVHEHRDILHRWFLHEAAA